MGKTDDKETVLSKVCKGRKRKKNSILSGKRISGLDEVLKTQYLTIILGHCGSYKYSYLVVNKDKPHIRGPYEDLFKCVAFGTGTKCQSVCKYQLCLF